MSVTRGGQRRGIDYLIGGGERIALNLGTGHGTSVKEIVKAVEPVSEKRLRVEYGLRREGDPPGRGQTMH